jgi:hypothetical protein
MKSRSDPPLPAPGSEIKTACGGLARFSADSPRILLKDRWIFFCLATCLEEFEQDPASSCYASQLTSEKQSESFQKSSSL